MQQTYPMINHVSFKNLFQGFYSLHFFTFSFFDYQRQPKGSSKIESVHPSVHPSVPAFSWNFIITFILYFGMVLEAHMKLCVAEPNFSDKNLESEAKMGQEQGFLNSLKLLLNLLCNENLCYFFLCSCTNTTFGKSFVLEIGTKCSQPI